MPVCVEKRNGKWRIVDCDTRQITKNQGGTAADGGGHSSLISARKQQTAINTSLHSKGKI